LYRVHASPEAHPASYSKGTGGSFFRRYSNQNLNMTAHLDLSQR